MVASKRVQVATTIGCLIIGMVLVAIGILLASGQLQIPMPGPVPAGVDLHLIILITGAVLVIGGVGIAFLGAYLLLSIVNIDPKLKKGIEYAIAIIPGVLMASWLGSLIFGHWPPVYVMIAVMLIGIPVWRLIDENYINAPPSEPA
jgi:hypothetical protein